MSIINVVLLTPLTRPLHTHTQVCSMVTWQVGGGEGPRVTIGGFKWVHQESLVLPEEG